MDTSVMTQLNNWFTGGSNMPLVVRGVRGVGKTYSVLQFADRCEKPYLYVNFENDALARMIFEDESKTIKQAIGEYFNVDSEALNRFLIILDEYRACNRDLTHSEAFKTDSDMKIVYLSSFDKNKDYEGFRQITVKPLGFREFLEFTGKTWYSDVIMGHYEKQRAVPELVHQEINDLFYDYLRVGGMPAVIRTYMNSELESDILDAQAGAMKLIRNDIVKYGENNSLGMGQIIDTVPVHISQDKPHFMPGTIRRGLAMSNIAEEMELLIDNGIVVKVNRYNDDPNEFRLNMCDCGLLRAMLYSDSVLRGSRLENELTTSVILSELAPKYDLRYVRTRGTSVNEYRFTNKKGECGAIICGYLRTRASAVKNSENVKETMRFSDENLHNRSGVTNLPLYMYEML